MVWRIPTRRAAGATCAWVALTMLATPLLEATAPAEAHRCMCPAKGTGHQCECPRCRAAARRPVADAGRAPPGHGTAAARSVPAGGLEGVPYLTGGCGAPESRVAVDHTRQPFTLVPEASFAPIRTIAALAAPPGRERDLPWQPETPPPKRA